MGVHPACLVCSIVAASLVAVETNVRETVCATNVAFVFCLWSVGVVSLLSAGPFCYFQLTRHKTLVVTFPVDWT